MTRYKGNIIHKRLKNSKYFGIILFLLLLGRLYYLQVYNGDDLRLASLKQRSTEISLNSKRGSIYDRNLKSLTDSQSTKTAIVPKEILLNDKEVLKNIKAQTKLSNKELNELLEVDTRLLKIPINKDLNIEEKNIFVANIANRYPKDGLLSHVIGYINKVENRGEYGIEKVYDEFLRESDKSSLFVEYDKTGSTILGSSYYVDNYRHAEDPNGVQLTIDYDIQSLVEDILDKRQIKGAVMIADIDTAEILASASRPNFDQEKIEKHLNKNDMSLHNKAIQVSYPPGSIFKIVVLLAALEENLEYINQDFYCRGYEEVNNLTIKCNNVNGHGNISLKDGFAKSCNSVFIQIGKELGAIKIVDMAKRLGFGEKINIGLIEEVKGNLPEGNELLGPAIGHISIGQYTIETTPLQITNMMLAIANDGVQKDMTIVKGITTKEGKIVKPYNKQDDKKILDIESTRITKNLLEEVVMTGTAQSLKLDAIGGAAGKTGSAQAFLKDDPIVHGWFTGFYPKENPKYAITVLVEKANLGSYSATPIFEEICENIYKLYN